MSRIDEYRDRLRDLPLDHWEAYLRAESRLPGPRGNLELAHAVADLAGEWTGEGSAPPDVFPRLLAWAETDADRAPNNTPDEFVAFCGVLALGEVAARVLEEERAGGPGGELAGELGGESAAALMERLRHHAADPRWRIREAVAQALQRVGDRSLEGLRAEAETLAAGSWLQRRAAMAAVCEPGLLKDPDHAAWAVALLDRITRSLVEADDASPDARVLRQGLGYGWSVAIAAAPDAGRPALDAWAAHPHPDARWIVRENLKKKRLRRLDEAWVQRLARTIG